MIRPITLWPFPDKRPAAPRPTRSRASCAVEMNMGQMVDDVRLAVDVQRARVASAAAPAA